MEFFNNCKTIRLRSHVNKFLTADDDQLTVRQSRNSSSTRSKWTVEMVEGKRHVIRLKSCSSGKYLTPSGDPFLLGMTGKKVVQDSMANKRDSSVEWEPIKEGESVKLRTNYGGKFLRANGGPPPWRNSVTYDLPHQTANRDWVLWDVEVVVDGGLESQESVVSDLSSSPAMSFSSSVPENGKRGIINGSPRFSGRKSGMELFHNAKAVRLKGYHGKYLVADDDDVTVRQSRNESSLKSRWTVESVDGNPNAIRLKSCHGLYLSATIEAFLLGMTGKKVQQYPAKTKPNRTTIWEPIKEGLYHVKLQTSDGKFLRANGGTPPWRNSVTHDIPHRTATQDWVLWEVEVVDILLSNTESESVMSSLSSFSSVVDGYRGSPDTRSPLAAVSQWWQPFKVKEAKMSAGMEFFRNAISVRLKSHHDKYLLAELHGENVFQDRQGGTSKNEIWNVEFIEGLNNFVRLKSVNGKYLTASEEIILDATGRKVIQSMPQILDSSIEWEPISDGLQVCLKTRYGNGSYLRADGGLPPWGDSVTHDFPYKHRNWILWDVEIVEARPEEPPPPPIDEVVVDSSETMNPDLDSSSFRLTTPVLGRNTETDERIEGRIIYYKVANDDGNVANEERWFAFKGHGLEDLTRNLEEQTGIDDIIVCSRNPLDEKLYPLRLDLPPNNSTMRVVVVHSTSEVVKDFLPVST